MSEKERVQQGYRRCPRDKAPENPPEDAKEAPRYGRLEPCFLHIYLVTRAGLQGTPFRRLPRPFPVVG